MSFAEGSWDDVMRIIGQAHSLLHGSGIVRIQTDIRVGSRTDKKQSFDDKIAAVRALLDNDDDGRQDSDDGMEGMNDTTISMDHTIAYNPPNSAIAPDLDRMVPSNIDPQMGRSMTHHPMAPHMNHPMAPSHAMAQSHQMAQHQQIAANHQLIAPNHQMGQNHPMVQNHQMSPNAQMTATHQTTQNAQMTPNHQMAQGAHAIAEANLKYLT